MSDEVNWQQLAEGFRLERNIMQEMAMKAREAGRREGLEEAAAEICELRDVLAKTLLDVLNLKTCLYSARQGIGRALSERDAMERDRDKTYALLNKCRGQVTPDDSPKAEWEETK